MSRWVKVLPALLVSGALVGCPGDEDGAAKAPEAGGETASPEVLAEGEQMYQTYCTACHGPEATGVQNLGKNLTTSAFVDEKSIDEMVAFINEGRPADHPLNSTGIAMPPKAGNPALTDDQIRKIAQYVKSLPPKEAP